MESAVFSSLGLSIAIWTIRYRVRTIWRTARRALDNGLWISRHLSDQGNLRHGRQQDFPVTLTKIAQWRIQIVEVPRFVPPVSCRIFRRPLAGNSGVRKIRATWNAYSGSGHCFPAQRS